MPLLRGNLGGMLGGGQNWLFNFQFNTPYVAPLSNPFLDGVGILKPSQVDGQLSISSGALQFPAQATPVTGDQGFYIEKVGGGAFARQSGRVALFKVNLGASPAPSFPAFGWSRSANTVATNFDVEVYIASNLFAYGVSNFNSPGGILTFATATDYYLLIWLLSTGARALVKGGVYTNWTLLFDSTQGNNATLYPVFDNYQSAGVMDFVKGKDLAVPYQTDYANIPGLVRVTSSNQSLGSDLVVNGNMEAGSPPSNWTPSGFGSIASVADERTGGSGSKSLQLTRTAAGGAYAQNSAVVTQHKIYQGTCWLKNVDASVGVGVFANSDSVGFYGSSGYYSGTTWLQTRRLWRNTNPGINVRVWVNGGADGQSGKTDDIEVKEITVNTPITTPVATHVRCLFPVPASPVAGDRLCMIVRLNAVGEEFYNCFSVEVIRNDLNNNYDISYCKYVLGVRSVFVTGTSGGNIDGVYVILEGNNHRVYSKPSGGNWSQRGTTIVDSNFANATLANVVYTDGYTNITELVAIPFNTGWDSIVASLGV